MGEVEAYNLKHWTQKIVNDPDLLPKGASTFCNIAVKRICAGMGYRGFDEYESDIKRDALANDIYMKCAADWARCDEKEAYSAALLGDLVMAAYHNPAGHGHCAIVSPEGPMVFSGKWNMYVPKVANVGARKMNGEYNNGIIGENYAFGKEPPAHFRLLKTTA